MEPLARCIAEYGFRQPVVVDKWGVIVVGHTRYKAALLLGLEWVPVHVASDLTPEQIRAYRIADNKLGELATWNDELLLKEVEELLAHGLDMELLGFSEEELAQLYGEKVTDGFIDPDHIPEPPDEATTKPGDLWMLGEQLHETARDSPCSGKRGRQAEGRLPLRMTRWNDCLAGRSRRPVAVVTHTFRLKRGVCGWHRQPPQRK